MRRVLGSVAVATAVAALPVAASAIPPGGASADTPGTSVTVTARTVAPGGSIGYRVTGFPAGQVINVKIDDGKFCPQAGTHGACVVQQQRIPASGPVVGSVQLPSDLAPGKHWLRFLASAPKVVNGQQVGTIGYTARGSSDFTVVATSNGGGSATPGSSVAPSAASTPTAGSSATEPAAGATLSAVPVGDTASTPASSAAPSASPSAAPVTEAAAPADVDDARFPLVGTIGLALLVLLAGGIVLRARRTRA